MKTLSATVLISALLMSAIVVVLPVQAEARTIVVPSDYSTIQGAINAASAGDIVFVRKGVYNETTLKIGKPLSLVGEDAVATWINLNPPWIEIKDPIPFDSRVSRYDYAIKIEADDVKLSGFTLNRTNTGIGGFYLAEGNRIQIVGNIILKDIFHFGDGSNNVFALNTVTSSAEFFCGNSTIAGNTLIGGSIWVGVGCSTNVIYGNTVVNDTEGIAVGGNGNIVANNTVLNNKFGVSAAADASNNTFYLNTVINNTVGLRIAGEGGDNTFYANYVVNNSFGAEVQYYFPVGDNNTLFCNNFMGNVKQVYTDSTYVYGDGSERTAYNAGYFDNGQEGNYWSDYNGVDANGDGVGDTPYRIDDNRRDNHPRIIPFDISSVSLELPEWTYTLPNPLPPALPLPPSETTSSEDSTTDVTPPEITVLSPTNQVYNESNVSIIFTVNEPCNWTGYSLDSEENMTATGNFTLTDLSNGLHNVTIHANDTFGNLGVSETISFTVAVPEPFPVVPVAAASAVVAFAAGAGLLVYFKKRKRLFL